MGYEAALMVKISILPLQTIFLPELLYFLKVSEFKSL